METDSLSLSLLSAEGEPCGLGKMELASASVSGRTEASLFRGMLAWRGRAALWWGPAVFRVSSSLRRLGLSCGRAVGAPGSYRGPRGIVPAPRSHGRAVNPPENAGFEGRVPGEVLARGGGQGRRSPSDRSQQAARTGAVSLQSGADKRRIMPARGLYNKTVSQFLCPPSWTRC